MDFSSLEQHLATTAVDPQEPFNGFLRRGDYSDDGGSGDVYLYNDMKDDSMVNAVKEMESPKRRGNGSDHRHFLKIVQNERKVLERLRSLDSHSNIVKTYLTLLTSDNKYFYSIMEFIPGGNLSSFIDSKGPREEATVIDYIGQLACGLHFLHSNDIVHYDMKTLNVLLDSDSTPTLLKICDYRLAKNFSESGECSTTYTFRGTYAFVAPEVAKNGLDPTVGFNRTSDLWSLGAIGVHLATGKVPYTNLNINQILSQLQRSRLPPELDVYVRSQQSKRVASLLVRLMKVDRYKRFTAENVVNLVKIGCPTFESAQIDFPDTTEAVELKLLNHFSRNGHSNLPTAVDLLNLNIDSGYWYGGMILTDDSVCFSEELKKNSVSVLFKDFHYFFGWERKIPDWEGEEMEVVENFLDSKVTKEFSASDIVGTIQSEYRGKWCSMICNQDQSSLYAPHNIILNIQRGASINRAMKIENAAEGKQLHNEFNAAVIRRVVVDVVNTSNRFEAIASRVKLALENEYQRFRFVVIANGPAYASGQCYDMHRFTVQDYIFHIRINWSQLSDELPDAPSPSVFDIFNQSASNPIAKAAMLHDLASKRFGGEWMSIRENWSMKGRMKIDTAGLIPGWEVPPVPYNLDAAGLRKVICWIFRMV